MKTKITLIIVILLVATLLNPSFAMASGHQANVFIVHGIPGQDVSPDLDPALPVDVSVNGACALPGFKFGEIVGPLPLDPGDYEIAISLANPDNPCSNDPVLGPITLPFEAGKAYSVVAHLTEAGGLTASLFTENISRVKPPKARVIVHHTAAAPAVDISIVRGPVPTLVIEDFSNGLDLGRRGFDRQGRQRRLLVNSFHGLTAGKISHDYGKPGFFDIGAQEHIFMDIISPQKFQIVFMIFEFEGVNLIHGQFINENDRCVLHGSVLGQPEQNVFRVAIPAADHHMIFILNFFQPPPLLDPLFHKNRCDGCRKQRH